MRTLTYTSFLGIFCLVAEILNLRKWIVPIVTVALAVIFGLNAIEYGTSASYYHDMLRSDNFSIVFSGLLILLAGLLVVLSGNFYKEEETKISDYTAIIIFTLSGALAMVSFANLSMFFIGLEVLSISLYLLAGSKKKDIRSNEAGMKYFLMGSFASGILLFGITLIYGVTGSFNLSTINQYTTSGATIDPLFNIGVLLILIAMLFKVSAAPFHFWAPDVYEGAPTLTTALMATVAKIAAFASFYRLFSLSFTITFPVFGWVLSAVAAITLLVGNLTALNQDSFKRMLAFSGISHAGYMLLAILSLYGNTSNSLFYYALAYGVSSIGAFAIAIAIAKYAGTDKIEGFNGLAKKSPFMAVALTLCMLSMAGIPPFAGFFAKYFIFSEAIRNGHLGLTVLGVVSSIIGVYYYFKVIVAMYTAEPSEKPLELNLSYSLIISLSVLLSLIIGIFPGWFSGLI